MKKNRFLYVILSVIFVLSTFSFTAFCQEPEAKLTVQYHLSDVKFDLYKIASANEEIDKTFKKYTDSVGLIEEIYDLSADELRTLATTLEALCVNEKIESDYSGNTDKNGNAVFENIEKGIYLIVGHQADVKDTVHTPSPVIVSVPVIYGDGSEPVYDAVVEHTKYEVTPVEETVSIKVMKIWDDKDKKSARPSKVTVKLLCDGETEDTVVLSAENNWEHEWTDLSADSFYKVVEDKIPQNYKMTVKKDGNKYVIKNTFIEDDDVPVTEEDDNDDDGGDDDDTIISTGQLWWPVPAMGITGVAFVLSGLIRRKQEKI